MDHICTRTLLRSPSSFSYTLVYSIESTLPSLLSLFPLLLFFLFHFLLILLYPSVIHRNICTYSYLEYRLVNFLILSLDIHLFFYLIHKEYLTKWELSPKQTLHYILIYGNYLSSQLHMIEEYQFDQSHDK